MEDLRGKLNKRVENEYENFIEELKKKPVEQMISSSYEKVFKEDLKEIILNTELEPQEVKALLKLDNVLQTSYDGWMDLDASYMDILDNSLRETIDVVVKDFKAETKQKNKQKDCR
ncbi:MAG: DUF3848 domain-containing protein [Oscillospiraceae bacterium]|nr:DUF3848 domain-containing protein [Oscillospiraceae bacterium]